MSAFTNFTAFFQRTTPKQRWLWGTLLMVVALAWFAPPEPDKSVVVRAVKPSNPSGHTPAIISLENKGERAGESLSALRPRQLETNPTPSDLFRSTDWLPPPPPPPKVILAPPAPPPKPIAPPVPYQVIGKKLESGRWLVFLSWREQISLVQENDVLDNAYRVESIVPPTMRLIYLPLNETQTINIGGGFE